jgi:hypothetical protein
MPGNNFMADAVDDGMFKGMRERPVADVVEQYGCLYIPGFGGADADTFLTQGIYSLAHQVHGAYGMMKTGMQGARVHHVGEAKLPDPPQTLKPRVFHQIEKQRIGKGDEAVNRIIEYFPAAE